MTYPAKVFRILIASPSDVQEEREQIVRIIQEWNDSNSFDRKVVLLPLRWETHAAPELGTRPQELINRDVVDHCDLALGVFWTRIGSPTGIAESGTIEEIERVGNSGKIVMLYFSKGKIEPEQINMDQWLKLKEFKKQTYPNGLVEHYSDIVDFRTKLSRQLDQKIKFLIATENSEGGSLKVSDLSKPKIELKLINAADQRVYENGATVERTLIHFSNKAKVPDFSTEKDKKNKKQEESTSGLLINLESDNKEYYREYLDYIHQINLFSAFKLSVLNPSSIAIRDIYIEIKIPKTEGLKITLNKIKEPPKKKNFYYGDLSAAFVDKINVDETDNFYTITYSPEALQPKREIRPNTNLFIGAKSTTNLKMDIRMYADCFSEPVDQKYNLKFSVKEVEVDALDVIPMP